MFHSLRFFIDRTPTIISGDNLLFLFSLFADEFNLHYNFITHKVLDIETGNSYIIENNYSWDEKGKKAFAFTPIKALFTNSFAEMSAPIITAYDAHSEKVLFNKCRVSCFYPEYSIPMKISIDFQSEEAIHFSIRQYYLLIKEISSYGFHINNSFYHICANINECISLDGGSFGGPRNKQERQNIKNYTTHALHGCLNHFMGVYCMNSIACPLEKMKKTRIAEVVGESNYIDNGEVIAFSLPYTGYFTSDYRSVRKKEIDILDNILMNN